MSVETVTKRAAKIQLENGRDTQGNMKYVSVSIGTLQKDRWDGDKALAIKDALAPCLSKTIGGMTLTTDATVAAS